VRGKPQCGRIEMESALRRYIADCKKTADGNVGGHNAELILKPNRQALKKS